MTKKKKKKVNPKEDNRGEETEIEYVAQDIWLQY